MDNIKMIACDIDGVLLTDTFSPVLYNMSKQFGIEYTRELERNLFSQKRKDAINYAIGLLGIEEQKGSELLNKYFEQRNKYIDGHSCHILEGVPDFLERMSKLDIKMVCYGGLEVKYIINEFEPFLKYFEQYICTNEFRPGIKEIVKKYYNFDYNEVLFIDDVNTVAEQAKKLGVPFIGIPAKYSWSYQKEDMKKTGVKYLLNGVNEIDEYILESIDNDITRDVFW